MQKAGTQHGMAVPQSGGDIASEHPLGCGARLRSENAQHTIDQRTVRQAYLGCGSPGCQPASPRDQLDHACTVVMKP